MWYYLDPYIMTLFGLTGFESLDGLVGTFLICLASVLLGEITVSLVYRANRKHLERLNRNLTKYSRLSQQALRHGDELSYQALNKQGNDAYGHVFFNNFGLSAASLWPIFFALDWMQPHFSESGIPLPLFASGANYVVVFLGCYIAARWGFSRLKRRLPILKTNRAGVPADDDLDREP
jgi:hypothetical protein